MNDLNLSVFSYDRDLNWYFNAANIPRQESVFATKQFIEQYRSSEITPLVFFNLLFCQKDIIAQYIDKPFDYLQHLEGIALSDTIRHTLYGMLLYWHGGSADDILDIDVNSGKFKTIIKLVEQEFQKQFPDQETPEKAFCTNEPAQRKLREVRSSIQAEFTKQNAKIKIAHSRYLDNIDINFGDLPAYVIDKAIVRKYEREDRMRDSEYSGWWQSLQDFINTIPQTYRVPALEKGIEYGEKCYAYHLANECTAPNSCPANESWERRGTLATAALQQYKKSIEAVEKAFDSETETQELESKNSEFTTARQVLALYYIFEHLQIRGTEVDKAAKERFVQFLTGKSQQNIHAAFTNPHINAKTKKFRFEDLQYIRKYFEDIGLSEIVKAINNQLDKPR